MNNDRLRPGGLLRHGLPESTSRPHDLSLLYFTYFHVLRLTWSPISSYGIPEYPLLQL